VRLLAAFAAHEARTQLRSLKFRVVAGVYLAVVTAPTILTWLGRSRAGSFLGPGTFAGATPLVQPFPTAIVAALLCVDGIEREREEGSLAVAGLAPVTNAGYLLRRWAALLALLVPLTLVPPAAGVLLSPRPLETMPLAVVPWLLRTLPVAVGASALALALGTITGGTVSAAVTGFLALAAAMLLGNGIASRFHRAVTGPDAWLGTSDFGNGARQVYWALEGFAGVSSATDGRLDVRLAAEEALSVGCLPLASCVLALGLAAAFLRRTRPDLRPFVVGPAHPLRSLVAFVNRLRVAYTPDPAPARADVALLAATLLAAGGLVAVWEARSRDALTLARERFQVETSGLPEPTPETLVPGVWRLRGALAADGRLTATLTATLRNTGTEPASRAAFSVNRSVAVTGAPVLGRRGDRLEVAFSPPVPAGGETTVTLGLDGRPADVQLADRGVSFVTAFRGLLSGRSAGETRDLSLATTRRLASPRRIRLVGSDLAPTPRYASFRLTPPSKSFGELGELVPPESRFPLADVEIDLAVPRGLFVADSCGHVATPEGRLTGACRISPAELALLGGPMTAAGGTSVTFAVLDGHEEAARLHAPALDQASELLAKAWPGLDALRGAVVLEWPPEWSRDPWTGMGWWYWGDSLGSATALGRVFLLDEATLVRRKALEPEGLAAQAVAAALLARRTLAGREQLAFRRLLAGIALDRLGKGRPGRAVLDAQQAIRVPVTKAGPYDAGVWRHKLPALVADLQYRAGARAFTEGLEEFLAARDAGPGTLRELVERIGRRGAVSLDRFYADFVSGGEIPMLTLEDVTFRSAGRTWEVAGVVRNVGTGESLCPIVLRTDGEAASAQVRVPSNGTAPFRLTTPYPPRTLLLDPDQRAFRLSRIGLVRSVERRSGP